MLCTPRSHFTADELRQLNTAYNLALPPAALSSGWSWNPVADEHAADLANVMLSNREWEPDPRILDIVNGAGQIGPMWGYAIWAIFTAGTDCHCCHGWRLAVYTVSLLGVGFVLGRM